MSLSFSFVQHSFTFLFGILLVILVVIRVRTKFRAALLSLPGPLLASWTRLWRVYDIWNGQAHETAIRLHQRYGKLVRVGPNVVSVSDPAMIPKIYDSRGSFVKSAFYPLQSITWHKRPHLNIFSIQDEAMHREMKKKISKAYTPDALLKMESAIDECGDLLAAHLEECADRRVTLDLGAWLHYYAFDVVGVVTFDMKLGFLESGTDVDGMIKVSHVMMAYFSCCGVIPFLHKLLLGNPVLPYIFPQMEAANHGLAFTEKAIRRRLTTPTGNKQVFSRDGQGADMLSRFLAEGAADTDWTNSTDLVVALSTNIFAGADTTAITLRATLYLLVKNPSKLARVRHEIDQAYSSGLLSDPPSDREVRDHLPYLNVAIREALRLHPATGLLMERYVPPGGAEICGRYIPGGTIVGINPWVIHYDPDVFPDPECFEPERWLDGRAEDGRMMQMNRSFIPFGGGSRMCMGKELSMIEVRKVTARLLREFDFEFEENQSWKVCGRWFTPQALPPCSVRRRQEK